MAVASKYGFQIITPDLSHPGWPAIWLPPCPRQVSHLTRERTDRSLMNRLQRSAWFLSMALLVYVIVGASTLAAPSAGEFFPIDELQVGMRGHALTVIQGTKIDSFEVEVLGLLPDATASGDLVLIRASGSVIDRTGGIASGMSGSPVYIDGKLLGAIGYGFSLADHTIGMVTPIGDMYRVLERIPAEQRTSSTPEPVVVSLGDLDGAGLGFDAVAVAPDLKTAERWQEQLGAHVAVAAPVRTPLMVSGLGERARERLGELLSDYDVVPVQAGGAPGGAAEATFEPGSALGVQLARGDVNVSSIGTVTYVDGDGFLAFGHPFFQMGDVDFITTTAYIHYTVNSLEFPFKLGSPLEPVGRLLQDRSAAIAGSLSSVADTIPVQINVFDRDANYRQTFSADIIKSSELTTNIASVVALEAIDRAIDRLGSGTSRVIMQVSGNELPKRIVRDNMYYSHSDIAATSLTEFLTGLEAVVSNEFEDVQITSIRLDVEVEKERWTARIVEANPVQDGVRPGESVDIEVKIRPYRGPEEVKVVRLAVPADVRPGEVTVTARSGGFGYFRVPSDYVPTGVDEPITDEDEVTGEEWERPSIYSLEGLLDVFMNREKNNEVVVEFFPYYSMDAAFTDVYDDAYYGSSPFLSPVQTSLTTRYVIQGSDTFTLRILPHPSQEPEDEIDPETAAESDGEPTEDAVEGEGEPADEDASADPSGGVTKPEKSLTPNASDDTDAEDPEGEGDLLL